MNSMILRVGLGEYGVTEIKGKAHNQRVLHYFKVAGHKWVKDDETAWCSAYMNYVCMTAGVEATGKLNARSWLNVGVEVDRPEPGNAVIFWRESESSWKGHIGIYIRETETHVYVLGGNQNNQVKISAYPKYRVLGYRQLRAVPPLGNIAVPDVIEC